ncbi:glycosyltransferase family 2 protein [Terasakiella sp. SH-1]|uniref:glycosyltransferase family 2 protein n=1 Tax=Terasakiella sp. SH-1 TaxID=2560057 RepID=UPI00143014A8|nr:glycosyltransferase family 2 protein [Terasakiella sp. SH-1]
MLDLSILILSALALYHHGVFPLILKMVRPQKSPFERKEIDWPKITLIVPVYNEENTIAEKIINTACLDYPADKLKLLIACDGCTDQSVETARHTLDMAEAANLNANILDFKENRGKVAALNDAIAQTNGDLIALSDCSSILSLDAIKRMARHFDDPHIGVVGGTYQFAQCGDPAEQNYWTYQRAIKKGEAHFGAPMGMHGAFYGFRKSLSRPLAAYIINDDFILPMKIVAQGYRAIYDEKICAVETEQTTEQMNWKRRVRISAGNVQQALLCADLLNPKSPGIAFCFFSGKFLRAWMPFILLSVFLLSGFAALEHTFYLAFFSLQLTGLGVISLPILKSKLILTLRYIIVGHLAGLVGALKYLLGLEKGAWKRACS